jgi:hypothetical protein
MSWERPVYSERAQTVSYDDQTQEMTVLWKNGKSTVYAGVPEKLALELSNAPSVGSMINSDFTGKFPHRNF